MNIDAANLNYADTKKREGYTKMDVEIKIPWYFDSREFYSYGFLKKINSIKDARVIFDFSETKRIDPIIVPNFLFLGKILKDKTGQTPMIYLPDTVAAGYLKNYLDQIKFTSLAKSYGLYDFITDPYGGLEGKHIDPLCRTVYFDGNLTSDEIRFKIWHSIKPFSDKYLSNFEHFVTDESGNGDYRNAILDFIYEAVVNVRKYAQTAALVSFHSRYKDGTINISISDIGKGFLESFKTKRRVVLKYDNGEVLTQEEQRLLSKMSQSQQEIVRRGEYLTECQAIIEGSRWESESRIYGLYNVIREVLEYRGWVRIHSNDTQVRFDEEIYGKFIKGELENSNIFLTENVRRYVPFEGVHIEIVIPMGERKYADI